MPPCSLVLAANTDSFLTSLVALQAGHSVAEEILLLVTHGILHLLGYDHVEPDEREEMFNLQRTLLLTFLASRGGPYSVPEPTVN